MRTLRNILRSWWSPLAYMALIWTLSSMSSPPSTHMMPFKDKGVHTVEYGVLAVLTARGVAASFSPISGLRIAAYSITASGFWGLLDEIHQAYVPGRSSEVADVMADILGATLGTLGFLGVRHLRRRRDEASQVEQVQ